MRKVLAIILTLSLVCSLVFANGASEQGKSKGEVVIYSPNSDSEIAAVIPAFEEATGIKVKDRIFKHLIPNVMPQLIVSATMGIGGTILTESTLSFLGLGVKHPLATWGTMINSVSSASAMAHYAYIWIPVGLLISFTVIAFNFIGDGLRDAYDPKGKR